MKFPFVLKKISHRLTSVYALLFFVGIILVNAATLLSINYYMNQTSAQQLTLIDQAAKDEIHSLQDIKDVDFRDISQMTNNIDINLLVGDTVIYNTGEQYVLPPPDSGNIKTVVKTKYGDARIQYLNDTLILTDQTVLGIQIIKDMNYEQNYLHVLSGIMLLIDVFVFLVSIVVGYIISKNALSPIDKITSQAKQISASDLTKRLQIDGPDDELKRLSDTFNDMIARIQVAYERQNQFTLDASHELATPLAVIKGYIDIMDRWGKNDPAILNEGIQSIQNELANMTRLLDTLLFIAKGDNEVLTLEKNEFDLRDLIAEVVRESRLVTDNHTIVYDTKGSLHFTGDHRMIKQMLRAIIDNSIKYTPPGGTITVETNAEGQNAAITMSDTGIGIPKADLPYIFDRFYRADKARSRMIGGAGLGLSIVKWIVEIHGGTITADSKKGEGTRFTIHLPLS